MNSLSIVVFLVAVAAATASIHGLGGAVIAGPAGAISAGVVPGAIGLGHAGLLGGWGGAGILGHGLLAGSGIEGQWIPDINEKLHDDGSYKPWVYGH